MHLPKSTLTKISVFKLFFNGCGLAEGLVIWIEVIINLDDG